MDSLYSAAENIVERYIITATAWKEFSEDMTENLKNLQESAAENIQFAKEKTSKLVANIPSSEYFQSVSSTFGAAKTKILSVLNLQKDKPDTVVLVGKIKKQAEKLKSRSSKRWTNGRTLLVVESLSRLINFWSFENGFIAKLRKCVSFLPLSQVKIKLLVWLSVERFLRL